MPNSVKSLHEQNLRLRNEIQKLKNSLRELSSSKSKPCAKANPPETPKSPSSNSKQLNWMHLPPTGKALTSSYCSERASMRASKAVQENLKKISALNESSESSAVATKPGESHSKLIDSFQSYYESEEENLSKFGKCELSYLEYKKDHEQGARRKERKMLQEIENLRRENGELKSKISRLFEDRGRKKEKAVTARSVTPRRRSNSSGSQGVKRVRTCLSFNSARRKHCFKCAALLAKGFSTVHCNKHRGK